MNLVCSKSFIEGKEEDLKEGRQKGEIIGIEKGESEGARLAQLSIATKILKHNSSDDLILSTSGITAAELA